MANPWEKYQQVRASDIDMSRPKIANSDGTFSTVRSFSFNEGGKEILIPSIVNGKQLTHEQAIAAWRAGENSEIGVFDTPEEATAYSKSYSRKTGEVREEGQGSDGPWGKYQAQPQQPQPVKASLKDATYSMLEQDSDSFEPYDPSSKPQRTAMDRAKGVGEATATLGTGMTLGLYGRAKGFIGQLIDEISRGGYTDNPYAAADRIEQASLEEQGKLTYTPKTEAGQEYVQNISKVGEALAPLGPMASPMSAEMQALSVSTKATGQLANAAMRNAIAGMGKKPLFVNGQPTPQFRQALAKRGLDYNNLTPETKALLSAETGKLTPKGATKSAIVSELKTGGRSDSLAPLKVVDDVTYGDMPSINAIKQGFEKGTIQTIKTTTPATRVKMAEMSGIMRQIKKQSNFRFEKRPSDVAGSVITDRIKFIRDKANQAKTDLDRIAYTNLKNKKVDTTQVINQLEESLSKYDVKLVMTPKGAKANYGGSMLSKDRTSQRIINDAIDLLNERVRPDALRAHKLKRQMDVMIDFNKKGSQGLTDAGKNVLKDIRRSLNDVVRKVDDGYAKANDTLSQSLDALGSLDDAVGTIDIFGKGADKALGTRMRALLSNQGGRIRIENAIDDLTDTVKRLGGKTDINIKDLIDFSDALDAKFGTPATTSFAGDIQKATSQVVNQGVKGAVREQAAQKVGSAFEKMRGINDDAAFESLDILLNRK